MGDSRLCEKHQWLLLSYHHAAEATTFIVAGESP